MKRLGYWFSEKKTKKLNLPEHELDFRAAGIELVQLDVNHPLDEQGPFDAILHKLADLQAHADAGYTMAQQQLANVKDYITSHPECIVIDPLPSMVNLLDRYNQYKMVQESSLFQQDSDVFMPTFVELTSSDLDTNRRKLSEAQVTYPIVCKPSIAHGSKLSHKMAIVFTEAGLSDLVFPCVAQSFINHNALLFKIYAVGDKYYIAERPSLKNFYAGDHKTIFFDTHNVSKRGCSHYLTILDKADMERSPLEPDKEKLCDLGSKIRQVFDHDLFGVDVIMDCNTKRYAIIDINSFPGYDEVEDFPTVLLQYLTERLDAKPSSTTPDSNGDQRLTGDLDCDLSSRKRLKPDLEANTETSERVNGEDTLNHIKTLESINGIHPFSSSLFRGKESSVCSNRQLSDEFNRHTNGHH
ncbi:inositol-tetrakisphosphate 1-kinase-like [Haliotis cracherodii]|uniref:inositol-tetrakisphosphate 1-kinase-like n=1 Tax=Haliotis cracherodii TaxID=6455 RepID=UPI0039E7A742